MANEQEYIKLAIRRKILFCIKKDFERVIYSCKVFEIQFCLTLTKNMIVTITNTQ